MNFDFGEVLTRAWKIIWKFKVLWIFGMLSSCGSRGSNSSNYNQQSGGNFYGNEIARDFIRGVESAGRWLEQNTWAIFALVALFIVIWFVQIALANIGRIGLIRGAYRADSNPQEIRFGELWSESLRYFWRVIGLSLTVWGPALVVLIGMAALFVFSFAAAESGGRDAEALLFGALGLFLIAFCCCLFPVLIFLSLYYAQAERALLLEELGVFAALKRGWEAFSANFLGLIIMGVVLFIINLVVGLAIAIPVYVTVLPLFFQLASGAVDTWTPVIVVFAILCAYSPIAWLLSGILASYVETVWTLVYARITGLPKKETDASVLFIESNA